MGNAILKIADTVGDPGLVGLVALLGVGLFLCFLGCRYYRASAGVAGFAIGLELAGRLAAAQGWSGTWTVVVGVVGGSALAALFVAFWFLGVFGLGAALTATLVGLAARAAGETGLEPLPLILAALVGGFGSLLLRQPVVIVSTSLYGGLMAIASLFAIFQSRSTRAALRLMTALRGADDVTLFLVCVAVLVTGGIVVQLRYGKNPKLGGG